MNLINPGKTKVLISACESCVSEDETNSESETRPFFGSNNERSQKSPRLRGIKTINNGHNSLKMC